MFHGYQVLYNTEVNDKYWLFRMIDNINSYAIKQNDMSLQLKRKDLL